MDSPTAAAALQGLKSGFQSAMKAAEAVGTKVMSAATGPSAPPNLACVPVQVKYNKDMFEIEMDATRPVARFFLQVYLKTGVFPPRQKIIGFKGMGPIPVEIDLRNAPGLREGMKLQLIQMPPGQHIEGGARQGETLAETTQRQYTVFQQRVDVLGELLKEEGAKDAAMTERMHKLSMFYEEMGMKIMLKVDEMPGEGEARAVRKALVEVINHAMDRVEAIKKATAPTASQPPASTSTDPSRAATIVPPTATDAAPAAPKVACELNNGVAAPDPEPDAAPQPRIDPLTGGELEPPSSPPLLPDGAPPPPSNL